MTNNTRFLILPWVVVPHLASHVLGLIARRIRADWQAKDVDLFLDKRRENCEKIVAGLLELRFRLTEEEQEEIRRGKDFIQLRNGPFDLDLIFAPDGIERFEDAWKRHVERHGLPIANIDDIIASKRAADRQRDRESLPRLLSFKKWLEKDR